MTLSQKLVSEFIGTFALIFVGVSSIVLNAGLVGIALAHGIIIAVMVSSFGYVSGGFFNPAVTVGAWVGGKINTRDTLVYILVQLFGGFVGAVAVQAIFPEAAWRQASLGTPMLSPEIGAGAGILMETILTFFLVIVVYGTAIDSRAPKIGGLFIGLTITAGILAGGPITGASMNPARTFGPALAGGFWNDHAVYWIGPLLGGVLAGLVYKYLIGERTA